MTTTRRAPAEFTVATFNTSGRERARALAHIKSMFEARPYLIAMARQEAQWQTWLPVWAKARGWRRSAGWTGTQLWWRNARGFKAHSKGNTKLTDRRMIEKRAAGPTNADEKRVCWVAGEANGIPTVIGSIHLVPSVYLPKARALSVDQTQALVRWYLEWRRKGYEVILMGDFNYEWDNAIAKLLRDAGLRLVSKGPTHGNRTIDMVLVSAGVEKVWAKVVPGHLPDDHRIPVVRVRVVGKRR